MKTETAIARASKLKFLVEELKKTGINQNAIAKKLGVSASALSGMLCGKSTIGDLRVARIEKSFNLSSGFFDEGQSLHDYISLRVINELSPIKEITYSLSYIKKLLIDLGINTNLHDVSLYFVNDDSMSKTFNGGDIAIVDMKKTELLDGIFVCKIKKKSLLKRIQIQGDRVLVISDNKYFKDWYLNTNIEILGQVLGKIQLKINSVK